jgi:hypothetical protein
MGNAFRPRWLLLLAGLGAMTGCARSTVEVPYPSYGPDPRIVAVTHALETDWDRKARLAEASPSRIVARAAAGEEPVRAPAAPAPQATPATQATPQRVASSSAGDAAGTPPRRNLWDKQPWEVELDRTVRGICRGC